MIYCLINVGNNNVVREIEGMRDRNREEEAIPDLVVVNAKPQKSASVLKK